MIRKALSVAGIALLAASTLLADFSYQESSKITGGAIAGMMKVAGVFSRDAREPMVSTVAVKGDRMVRHARDHVQIMDLSSDTITMIDMQKKTYTVMTFAEMKQSMEQAMQKMQSSKKPENADMQFKVSASATGNTKNISGFDAKEMVVKIAMEGSDQKTGERGAMVVTSHVWVAANVPGYEEVRDFQKRMAAKLAWTPGSNTFMADPNIAKGMAEAYKEISKLDGVPVLTVTSMGAEGTAPADGAVPAAQPQQETPKPTIGGALGGALGGRFGLGRKKQDQSQQQTASSGNAGGGSASLIDLTSESSNFSTAAIDSAQFEVPAGFKKIDSPMLKK
jgi:hypothetical protein